MPLPPGARVGTLPDGTPVWIDANGQPLNPDGTPMQGAQTATPLASTPATRPIGSTLPPLPGAVGQVLTTPQPTTTTDTGTGVAVPAAQNIDPNASAPKTATDTAQTPTTPGTSQPQGPPIAGLGSTLVPGTAGGNYSVDQITAQSRQEITDANAQVQQAYTTLGGLQNQYAGEIDPYKQQQLTTQINGAYTQLSQAESRVATANAAYASTLTKALSSTTLDPAQTTLYQAQADAATKQGALSDANAKVLLDGADTQKALVAANAGLASANATNALASANATAAKTPDEKAALEAQAAQSRAQADQITQLLPGLIDKQKADTTLTVAQTGLTDANSDLAKANTAKVGADTALVQAQTDYQKATTTGLLPAQIAETQSRTALQGANAQAALAGIQQKQLGPLYGLQDQVNAIRAVQQQVFGPGGSGDPQDADNLLKQYVTATIGGTTPYAATVAAQNAQQNIFQTQAAMANQQSQAAATRAGQFANLAGGTLGTLEQMNQYAPKGSNAMAGAFGSVLDYMAQRLQQPQFAAPQMPQAPPLPAFLQAFAAGHQAGTAQASAQGGQQAAPSVNININGQPAGGTAAAAPAAGAFNPQASTAAMNAAGFLDTPAGRSAMAAQNPAGATPAPAGPTPAQAFAQGFSQNAPTLPDYLQGLVNPMSMLQSAQGLYSA